MSMEAEADVQYIEESCKMLESDWKRLEKFSILEVEYATDAR